MHFGNRSMSLEDAGGPSQLVINCSQPFYSTASTQILHTDSERTFSPGITSNHGGIFMGSSRTSSEKVIEVLHYLAPEQTSSYASVFQEDHRTDLYSLGMLFWTCVVGRGRLPFISPDHDYSPAIILAASGTTRPPLVSEVRNDVPTVISDIIDKARAPLFLGYHISSHISSCRNHPMRAIKVHMDSRLICSSVRSDFWPASRRQYP